MYSYSTNFPKKNKGFIFISPKVSVVEEEKICREKILDRLKKAAHICNLLIKGKHVPGLHPGHDLSEKEIDSLKVGMSHLSFILSNTTMWPRTLDFELESFCDCKITVGYLKAIGIHTLWNIIDSKEDDYRDCLAIAEKIYGAEKQYHMLALVKRSEIDN